MSDQPDKPEEGDSASGESAIAEPELLNADDVRLAEPDVSADAVEPALETSPEEVHLTEPSLGAAEISEDAAEAASLDEAAAEAESVAREAEQVGTLVGGPRPPEDPAEVAAPAGTAPAGGTAGDAPAGGTAGDAAGKPDGDVNSAADEPATPPMASFAASGDEPTWAGQGQDQSRWDALFDAGQAGEAAVAGEPRDVGTADAAG